MAGPTPVGSIESSSQIFGGSSNQLPSGGPGSPDLDNLLRNFSSGIDKELLDKALLPVTGGHAMQMPASLQREIPNPPPAQLDHREVVGAGNARGQGIGNAVSATIGALSTFKATRDRAKQTADATKVSRLIEAQQSIDQAQQILKQDPNNADAKEALQHNIDVRNGMFTDPKFVKTVEKGFQISFTDPSANKTPEHNIVQKGIDLFKKQSPNSPDSSAKLGEQFASKMPQQLAPNLIAQQRLQYVNQIQQQWQKLMQSMLPRIYSAQSANQREAARQSAMSYRQNQAQAFNVWKIGQEFQNRKELADINNTYRLGQIGAAAKAWSEKMYDFMTQKELDPVQLFQNKLKFQEWGQKEADNLDAALADAEKTYATIANKDAASSSKETKAALKMAAGRLTSIKVYKLQHGEYVKGIMNTFGNLEKMGAGKEGVSGDTPGGAGAGSTPTGIGSDGANTFSPDALFNAQPFNFGLEGDESEEEPPE